MVTLHSYVDRNALLKLAAQFPELDVDSVEVCLTFLDTTADVHQAFDVHFSRYHLSMGKFAILMQLFQADEMGLTPSEFAERSGVTRATITGLLDGLERDGLIKREPYPGDRRMTTIHLTEQGRQHLITLLPDHFCRTTKLMANLSSNEKKIFLELLTKLRSGTPAIRNP